VQQATGQTTAYVTGSGTLVASGARFTAIGGWATRRVTVVVRY
jgi:hypothetical protein